MSLSAADAVDEGGGGAVNAATALSMVFADEFTRCGITDIVIAPGARCGPIVQALHRRAMMSGQRLHTHFDERAAGFLALGLAKRDRRPVVVVCTSGTASANLHPAVLEASHSHLPLIVLTADRPPELRGTGASQTTDQLKLYGSAVRLFVEVGLPCLSEDVTPSAESYWRSLVCRVVAAAARGPAHLNVALREPLNFTPCDDIDARFSGRPDGEPWVDIASTLHSATGPNTENIVAQSRGVVIVGDDAPDPDAAVAFAEAAGWPLLAEPHSNARKGIHAISTYRYLLGHAATRRRLMPDTVVSFGRPGISREVLALMRDVTEHIVVDPHHDWADPSRSAHRVVPYLTPPAGPPAHPCWLAQWRSAEKITRTALDSVLDDSGLNEPRLVRDILIHLPDNALCLIGPSMPIRNAETTMPPRHGLRIISNRGLAGIDGNTSTAIGAALAHQDSGGGPAYAIVGDLTFLHDASGLITCGRGARPDLTIIVINNQGGGIFSLVEHTADAIGFDDLFGTPHTVDIAGLAAATGWQHEEILKPSQLIASLHGHGPRILEVRTNRDTNAELHHRIKRHVAHVLDQELCKPNDLILGQLRPAGCAKCVSRA